MISTVLKMVEVRHDDHVLPVDNTQREIDSSVGVGLILYVQLGLTTRCLCGAQASNS